MPFYAPEYLNIVSESQLLNIINEEYFVNNDLLKIEKLIGELRTKYYNINNKQTAINIDPLIKEISLLFENVFGFNSFQLIVEQKVREPNAYTIPLSSKIDIYNYKKCIKKTNQGIQFTPIAKVNVIAHITSSLLLDNKYTDREILAILLHEIGHNFSDSIDGNLGLFSSFKKVLFIPYIFINPIRMTNVGTNININFNDYMRKNNPKLVSAFNALKLFTGKIKYAMINLSRLSQLQPSVAVSSLIMQFHKMIVGALRNPAGALTNVLFKFVGKHDEYVSDSFVAMYGYGPDLSSALLKLERTNPTFIDDIMKSGEFSAAYFSVVVEFVDYIGMLLTDNHPSTGKRLLNVLNVLEQQYNKNYINPKTKKAIKEEIDEIKELIEKEQREYAFEGNKWRIEWNKYVLANSSNKGPKEKMVKELIDTIDNMEEIKD